MALKKKVVLLGDSAVGKTSLIRRFVFDKFEDAYITTIGSKVTKKEMMVSKGSKDTKLTLMIWDVLGREGYAATHAKTFAGVHGAFLVADFTRRETLISLERYWIPLLLKVVGNVPLVFVCNKSDLVDEIAFEPKEMKKISSRYNIGLEDSLSHIKTCYSTSAKTGENVENTFESLGHLLLSEAIPKDPIKDLFEDLIAERVYRQTDKKTLIGAADALIMDFCNELGDDELAMSLLRRELVRAGVDLRRPSKESLLKAIEYLAEAESELKEERIVLVNKERRMRLVRSAR